MACATGSGSAGEGYRRSRLSFDAPPPIHTCELEALAALEGQVLSASETPIAGATVSIIGTRQQIRSDDDGRFATVSLGAGTYEIQVAANGYQPQRLPIALEPGEQQRLPPVHLLPGRDWVLRVVEAGSQAPVFGAQVRAVEPPGALIGTTDSAGELQVRTADEGNMEVEVRAEGYPRTLFPVDLAECSSAEEPVLFELRRGGRIRVVMWDEESGEPCSGCSVHISGAESSTLVTDGRGSTVSGPLAAGLYQVTPERLESLGALVTRRGGADSQWARVEADGLTEVRFGEPARVVEVEFSPSAWPGWSLETRSEMGRRLYAAGTDGRYQIRYGGRRLEIFLVDGQGRSVRQAILPAEWDAASLRSTLPRTLLGGQLVAGDTLAAGRRLDVVSVVEGTVAASATTGVDGGFSIPFLSPGAYALLVDGQLVRTAAVGAGQDVDLGRVEVEQPLLEQPLP